MNLQDSCRGLATQEPLGAECCISAAVQCSVSVFLLGRPQSSRLPLSCPPERAAWLPWPLSEKSWLSCPHVRIPRVCYPLLLQGNPPLWDCPIPYLQSVLTISPTQHKKSVSQLQHEDGCHQTKVVTANTLALDTVLGTALNLYMYQCIQFFQPPTEADANEKTETCGEKLYSLNPCLTCARLAWRPNNKSEGCLSTWMWRE